MTPCITPLVHSPSHAIRLLWTLHLLLIILNIDRSIPLSPTSLLLLYIPSWTLWRIKIAVIFDYLLPHFLFIFIMFLFVLLIRLLKHDASRHPPWAMLRVTLPWHLLRPTAFQLLIQLNLILIRDVIWCAHSFDQLHLLLDGSHFLFDHVFLNRMIPFILQFTQLTSLQHLSRIVQLRARWLSVCSIGFSHLCEVPLIRIVVVWSVMPLVNCFGTAATEVFLLIFLESGSLLP